MARDEQKDVWYEDGLRFECTRCGACCGGEPGYVWVTDEEIAAMAEHLGIPVERFTRDYCRRAFWRISLRERRNGDCAMLTEEGCAVYPVRPEQCRTWPFWPDNIIRRGRWIEVRERCPGAGRGKLYSRDRIDRIADGDEDV
jgi:hypothetical protein